MGQAPTFIVDVDEETLQAHPVGGSSATLGGARQRRPTFGGASQADIGTTSMKSKSALTSMGTKPSAAAGSASSTAHQVHLAESYLDRDVHLVSPSEVPDLGFVYSWAAHSSAVASLSTTGAPCALISVETRHNVKVWSTSGELWADFP